METILALVAALYALASPPAPILPAESPTISASDATAIVTGTALVGGIVGYSIPHPSGGGSHAKTEPVPEPATLAGLGLGAVALIRRRHLTRAPKA